MVMLGSWKQAIHEIKKMVIDWIQNENLILLNDDMNCEGLHT